MGPWKLAPRERATRVACPCRALSVGDLLHPISRRSSALSAGAGPSCAPGEIWSTEPVAALFSSQPEKGASALGGMERLRGRPIAARWFRPKRAELEGEEKEGSSSVLSDEPGRLLPSSLNRPELKDIRSPSSS